MKVIKPRSRTVGIGEAKAHFSKLVRGATRGEEWIITERGRPVARLGLIERGQTSLEDRVRMLERAGSIEPATMMRPLPPPLPLESGLATRFLNDDRG